MGGANLQKTKMALSLTVQGVTVSLPTLSGVAFRFQESTLILDFNSFSGSVSLYPNKENATSHKESVTDMIIDRAFDGIQTDESPEPVESSSDFPFPLAQSAVRTNAHHNQSSVSIREPVLDSVSLKTPAPKTRAKPTNKRSSKATPGNSSVSPPKRRRIKKIPSDETSDSPSASAVVATKGSKGTKNTSLEDAKKTLQPLLDNVSVMTSLQPPLSADSHSSSIFSSSHATTNILSNQDAAIQVAVGRTPSDPTPRFKSISKSPAAEEDRLVSMVNLPSSPIKISTAVVTATWSWSPKLVRGEAPPARWGHSATLVDGRLLVYGGYNETNKTLNDLFVLDIENGVWHCQINGENDPRAWHSATYVPSKRSLLVFGGEKETETGETDALKQLMVLDCELMLWYPPVVNGAGPSARAGHSATLIDHELILFGGCAGRKWLNDVHVLDLERWSWSKPSISGKAPFARSYHTSSILPNQRILFVGGNNSDCSYRNIHILNRSNWSWEHPQTLGVKPAPLTGHSCNVLDDRFVVVFGGWDYTSKSDAVPYEDVFLLDTLSWTWHSVKSIGNTPGGRVGHTAVTVGDSDQILCFGGYGKETFWNDLYILSKE
eukprot:GILJ01013893.1.p1 GENE.GILJ01013893.1~~GILJ01013893.1.p1  ORF type:complete len:606 (+),score=74.32 GILJ01013893.1:2-1819(+)